MILNSPVKKIIFDTDMGVDCDDAVALAILLNNPPEILSDVMKYVMYNPPIYTFIASILLFIGSKYRGNIEKLV